MKILFHHRIASRDGQWVHIEELIEALRGLGHEVVLVGPGRLSGMEFGGESGLVARLKRSLPLTLYEILELGYNLPAFWRLWRVWRRERPHALYERYSLYLRAGVWLHRLTAVPFLLEVNGPLFEERTEHDGLALRRFAARCQRGTWRAADFALPVTDALAGYLRAAGVPAERVVVVPNGINQRRFAAAPSSDDAKRRLGLDGRLVIGFTGFVRSWHQIDQVIDLLPELGPAFDLHLLLVGDGPAVAGLRTRARERGVADRLSITGIVPRDAVAAHVAAFDIALQPGVTAYASPLKLFEYMALGRAIIAPDQANIREVLQDGENALLFDVQSPGAMAAAVRRLCGDAALRGRLGASALAVIEERGLTWTTNARRVVALAEAAGAELAARHPPGAEPRAAKSDG